MTQNILYQNRFFVSNIMCHKSCGSLVRMSLEELFSKYKSKELLPQNAELSIDAEPQGLGIHCLNLIISSEEEFQLPEYFDELFSKDLAAELKELGYPLISDFEEEEQQTSNVNWINILVNLSALALIFILWLAFPPSIPLTIVLASLSFLTTAFTAREYLYNFFRNLRYKNLANMTSVITLGWFLSLAHTLYHSILMPLASGFSMVFMSFMMPPVLMSLLNGMEEIKRQVAHKSKKMQLQGLKTLFPQMESEYDYYPLSSSALKRIQSSISEKSNMDAADYAWLFSQASLEKISKTELKEGMCIEVKRGSCFPVDCTLIYNNTLVDASLLTGEPCQTKHAFDSIPAGAINLGPTVTVFVNKDAYNSSVNQILLKTNRAAKPKPKTNSKFLYLYGALIVMGIVASIATPYLLGLFTLTVLLQNAIGILFAICPCTIAIAHQLPMLLSIFQRSKKGIIVRDEAFCSQIENIHTIVFDKTGTLTTGDSTVYASEGISEKLWQRIYLLEKKCGGEHPIAKALIKYWGDKPSLFNEVKREQIDSKNRGLSAIVQGKLLHLGNAEYFLAEDIELPKIEAPAGMSTVYVAENKKYKGVIFVQHEARENLKAMFDYFKAANIERWMVTGDDISASSSFDQQNGSFFGKSRIRAGQTPTDKEEFLRDLMKDMPNPQGLWFIGDGLNDGPCARIVSEMGGTSCAINSKVKVSFFSDLSLNGCLDYLMVHFNLNRLLNKTILQNKALLLVSSVIYIAFVVGFPFASITLSPLIPLVLMLSTTGFILFNSYRAQISVDLAMDHQSSLPKQLLGSDLSFYLLLGSAVLLVSGFLIATIASGGLAFPLMVFTGGIALALASTCILAGGSLLGFFSVIVCTYLLSRNTATMSPEQENQAPQIEEKEEFFEELAQESTTLPLGFGGYQRHLNSVVKESTAISDYSPAISL